MPIRSADTPSTTGTESGTAPQGSQSPGSSSPGSPADTTVPSGSDPSSSGDPALDPRKKLDDPLADLIAEALAAQNQGGAVPIDPGLPEVSGGGLPLGWVIAGAAVLAGLVWYFARHHKAAPSGG